MTDRYDTDFVLWSEQQAALLRRMAVGLPINAAPDWDNIAEEIESLGKSDRRELINRIVVLLDHLMRLASPAHDPRRGWRSTVAEQRRRIAQLLNAKWAARSMRCTRPSRACAYGCTIALPVG